MIKHPSTIAKYIAAVFLLLLIAFPATAYEISPARKMKGSLVLTPEEQNWLDKNPVIQLAGPRSFPPFHYYEKTGVMNGIAADYIAEILSKLGISAKIHSDTPWTEVLHKAQTGSVDLIPCIAKTADRETFLNFSTPYLSFPLVIVTKKDAPFIGGIENLHGKKLAIIPKSAPIDWLKHDRIGYVPYYIDSPLQGFKAVSFGKADAQIENLAAASYLIQKNGLTNLKIAAPTHYGNHNLHMAIRKNLPELAGIINKAILSIPPEQHNQILNKWLSVRYEYGLRGHDILKWVAIVTSFSAGILLVFFIWNRRLTKEIFERKQVEQALIESENRLIAAGKTSYDLIYEWDIESNSLDLFGNLQGLMGYGDNEIPKKLDAWLRLIHPDDTESFKNSVKVHGQMTKPIHYEYKMRHKNGDYKYIKINGLPIADKNGKPHKWVGACTDITQQKKAEKELSRAAKEWQMTFDAMSSAVWVLDTGHQITRANKTASKMFDQPVDKIIGKPYWEVVYGGLHNPETCLVQAAQKNLHRETAEELIGQKWFEITVEPILGEKGNYEGSLQILNDISRRKQNEAEKQLLEDHLRQTHKMEAVGNLAGGIAHDFNNLLGIILGNISYAETLIDNENKISKILSNAHKGAKQAKQLTLQLLTFAKGGEPVKKSTDINALLKESTELATGGGNCKCDFDLAPELWSADVDPGQLNQAVSNLIINATQAMPEGGRIQLVTKNITLDSKGENPLKQGKYVLVQVIDTGIGIQDKYLAKIFDPFFTTRQEGTGLGLSTTFSIIKRHGGHISVQSKAGEGAAFNIYLPSDGKTVIPSVRVKKVPHTGGGRILIMDDQEFLLDIAGKMFELHGYTTISSTDGTQAINLYKEALNRATPFDLVVLDLTVPGGMGGAETMVGLLAIDPNVKAVVSSGYSNDPIMADYRGHGFCGILQKPYTKADITELLTLVFDNSQT